MSLARVAGATHTTNCGCSCSSSNSPKFLPLAHQTQTGDYKEPRSSPSTHFSQPRPFSNPHFRRPTEFKNNMDPFAGVKQETPTTRANHRKSITAGPTDSIYVTEKQLTRDREQQAS